MAPFLSADKQGMATALHHAGERAFRESAMCDADRRRHRRLAIRLPLEYRINGHNGEPPPVHRSVCRDVSCGGVNFETDCPGLALGTRLTVDLLVPPGDGHSPYPGRVHTEGQVVRVEPLSPSANATRWRVSARFTDSPQLHF